MANIKITDLSAYSDPESTDVLPIVDVTNDATKKVSIADLMENAGAGAEATPGIAFDGDPDTGIYRPGADQIAISTGGTQRLAISDTGAVTIPGNLTVQGTTTFIDSQTLQVEDKNIEMGVVTTPTDTTADGGGITLKGATDKTINWVNATDAWTSSERFDFPAGTAAAPSIILNGDVNSGIYQPGADQVAISTGGTGRLFVNANGRIGVGTSAPAELLDISPSGEAGAILLGRAPYTSYGSLLVGNNEIASHVTKTGASTVGVAAAKIAVGNGTVVFSNSPIAAPGVTRTYTETARIDSSGRLLVGTSTALNQYGSQSYLQVAGTGFDNSTIALRRESANANPPGIIFAKSRSASLGGNTLVQDSDVLGTLIFAGADGTDLTSVAAQIKTQVDGTPGANDMPGRLVFETTADGASSPTERMRIDSSGRVGVNTTSPSSVLTARDEGGTDLATLRLEAYRPALRFIDINTSTADAEIVANAGSIAFNIGLESSPSTLLSEKVRIDPSGRVGVGTSAPNSAFSLDVATGAVRSNGNGFYVSENYSATNNVYRIYDNSSQFAIESQIFGNTTSTSAPIVFRTSSSDGRQERMRITAAGNVGVGTTSPVYALDCSSSAETAIRIDSASGSNAILRFSQAGTNKAFVNYQNGGGLTFGPAGSEAARFDASGRLGIGTSSPQHPLQINATNPRIRLQETSSGGDKRLEMWVDPSDSVGYIGANQSAQQLSFQTASTDRIRITNAGNVGIGVTSPGGLLHLNQNNSNDVKFIIENDDGQFSIIANNNTAKYLSSQHIFLSASGAVEKARLDSSGRLLVGTSTARSDISGANSPQLQIESVGTDAASSYRSALSIIKNGADVRPAYLILGKSRGASLGSDGLVSNGDILGEITFVGSDGSELEKGATVQAVVDGTPGANDLPTRLVFSTTADGASSPTERMRITNNGRTEMLFGGTAGFYPASTQAAGTTATLIQGVHSRTGIGTGGTTCFRVWTNGNVENTNNSYGSLSDIKLKENIVDASSQWDDLKAIQVRNYNFKEGQTHTQIGVVAQEVELVSPGLVSESPDRDEEGNDLGTVTKSVNYSVLYMKAVKALQEAMERIETLEAKVSALEAN